MASTIEATGAMTEEQMVEIEDRLSGVTTTVQQLAQDAVDLLAEVKRLEKLHDTLREATLMFLNELSEYDPRHPSESDLPRRRSALEALLDEAR